MTSDVNPESAECRLHVGLNLVFLTPGRQGGMEIYARELIRRLAHRDDLRLTAFVNHDAQGNNWGGGVQEILVPVHAEDRKQWVFGEQVHLPKLAQTAGCAIVHSFASTAPLWGPFKRVTTIHDLNYKLVPEAHARFLRYGMRILVAGAARRSHRIIADSVSTANDLATYLRVPRHKTDVIPLGVNLRSTVTPTPAASLRRQLGLGHRPVVLSVSAKRPSKNLERLIRAHACLAAPRPVLVLPGYPTPYEATLQDVARDIGILRDTRFLGWVSAEDIEGLYGLATVFAFPSLYEGFGLPPLEAMARGVPVVTSDRGALAEVVGSAALVVNPESITEIAAAVRRLLVDTDERQRLRERGLEWASRYSWDHTAAQTVQSYRRVVKPDAAPDNRRC